MTDTPGVVFGAVYNKYYVVLLRCGIIQLDLYHPWHILVNMQIKYLFIVSTKLNVMFF